MGLKLTTMSFYSRWREDCNVSTSCLGHGGDVSVTRAIEQALGRLLPSPTPARPPASGGRRDGEGVEQGSGVAWQAIGVHVERHIEVVEAFDQAFHPAAAASGFCR